MYELCKYIGDDNLDEKDESYKFFTRRQTK